MKIVVGSFTGIGLGFALMGQMESAADRLAATGRPSLILDAVGFQDQWVVAADRESGEPLRDGVKLMLLGESGGAYTFYDCGRHETFRVAVEATTLEKIVLFPDRPESFDCRKQNLN